MALVASHQVCVRADDRIRGGTAVPVVDGDREHAAVREPLPAVARAQRWAGRRAAGADRLPAVRAAAQAQVGRVRFQACVPAGDLLLAGGGPAGCTGLCRERAVHGAQHRVVVRREDRQGARWCAGARTLHAGRVAARALRAGAVHGLGAVRRRPGPAGGGVESPARPASRGRGGAVQSAWHRAGDGRYRHRGDARAAGQRGHAPGACAAAVFVHRVVAREGALPAGGGAGKHAVADRRHPRAAGAAAGAAGTRGRSRDGAGRLPGLPAAAAVAYRAQAAVRAHADADASARPAGRVRAGDLPVRAARLAAVDPR